MILHRPAKSIVMSDCDFIITKPVGLLPGRVRFVEKVIREMRDGPSTIIVSHSAGAPACAIGIDHRAQL